MDQNSLGSLAFFEGTRILLPGVLTVLIGALVSWTAGVPMDFGLGILAFLIVGVGFLLYLVDLPEFAPEFYHLGPTKWLERRASDLGSQVGRHIVGRIDYLFLDDLLPAGVRLRSQYYRVMFRIGLETSLVSVVGMAVAAGLSDANAQGRPSRVVTGPAAVFALFVFLSALVAIASIRLASARSGNSFWKMVRESIVNSAAGLAVAFAGIVLVVLGQWWMFGAQRAVVVGSGCAAVAGVWVWTVLVGRRREDTRRYVPTSEKNVILFMATWPLALVLANVAAANGRVEPLIAWCGLVVFIQYAELRRRYMDRYEGASQQQIAWMSLCTETIDRVMERGRIESDDINEMRTQLLGSPSSAV